MKQFGVCVVHPQPTVFVGTMKVGARVTAGARWTPYGADRVPRQRGGSGAERGVRRWGTYNLSRRAA